MTQARIIEIKDGGLLPWQQPNENYESQFQSHFNDDIPKNCDKHHRTVFPEIDTVAAANGSLVCKWSGSAVIEEEDEEYHDLPDKCSPKNEALEVVQTTPKCMCNYGKSSSGEQLKSFSLSNRKCFCSPINEGEEGIMCAWGGPKNKARPQNSGASVSKRKPYISVFQRLFAEHKYTPYHFRHVSDSSDYMAQYRKCHTVADVGKESRPPPKFGVDVPDPYAIRIKNICSIVNSCDFTALLPGDTDASCSDLSSVMSAESGGKEKERGHDRTPQGDNPKRKKGDKPSLTSTRSVPSLTPVRQKKSSDTADHQHRRADDTTEDHMKEYERLRRERELQKSNTLPQILLRQDAELTVKPGSRPSSDSSSATQRLLDQLQSPFKRFLQYKHIKGGHVEFLRETYHQKSTSVKLSEFLSTALLGDGCLRTGFRTAKVTKPKVKERKGDNKETPEVHLPELVGRTCDTKKDSKQGQGSNESQRCANVLSVSFDEVPKTKSIRKSTIPSAGDQLPIEYKIKKRQMQKVVDLMSIAR
ncbi:uncharacterized protein [Haliotis cracherodii]|uniref:uncharacterized protein n=1 Tax=Haliotis cracherodii TaxID=6455 RepID=UPI0039EB4939